MVALAAILALPSAEVAYGAPSIGEGGRPVAKDAGGQVPAADRRRASKKLKAARKLLKKGKAKHVAKALAKLEAAFGLHPSPEIRLELASGHVLAGQIKQAQDLLSGFMPDAAHVDASAAVRRRIDEALSVDMTKVRVESTPTGSSLTLRGASLFAGETPWEAWLPFGTYELTVSADGSLDHEELLEVERGKPRTLSVKLESTKPGPSPALEAAAEVAPSQVRRSPEVAKTMQQGIRLLAESLSASLLGKSSGSIRRVAVMPFETLEEQAKQKKLGPISAQLLSVTLAKAPRILQVERAQLDSIVSELKRSETGALDPGGAVSVGKLVGANSVVLGSIASVGPTYAVTARVVETETGVVITAAEQSFHRQGMVAFSEEVVEVKSKSGAAARSAALPGWGQMYNGDDGRALVFGGAFLVVAAGAIASAIMGVQAQSEYQENVASTVGRRDEANDSFTQTNLLLAGLGAVWAVAVGEAYISGRNAETINLEAARD